MSFTQLLRTLGISVFCFVFLLLIFVASHLEVQARQLKRGPRSQDMHGVFWADSRSTAKLNHPKDRNPRLSGPIKIPAKKVAKFKAGTRRSVLHSAKILRRTPQTQYQQAIFWADSRSSAKVVNPKG